MKKIKIIIISCLIFVMFLCLVSFVNKNWVIPNAFYKMKNKEESVNYSATKGNPINKKLNNYQCKKCRTFLQSDKTPNSLNCPSGHFHQWTNLGEVGNTNYQCKKCGLLIKSKRLPSSLNCPSGHFHQWSKL